MACASCIVLAILALIVALFVLLYWLLTKLASPLSYALGNYKFCQGREDECYIKYSSNYTLDMTPGNMLDFTWRRADYFLNLVKGFIIENYHNNCCQVITGTYPTKVNEMTNFSQPPFLDELSVDKSPLAREGIYLRPPHDLIKACDINLNTDKSGDVVDKYGSPILYRTANISNMQGKDISNYEKLLIPFIFKKTSPWLIRNQGFCRVYITKPNSSGEVGAIAVFKGTSQPEELFKDLSYSQVDFYGGKIHSGFHDIYAKIRTKFLSIIELNSVSYVITCGMSLGSAVAALAAYDVGKNKDRLLLGKREISTYLYGCPRVGNSSFVEDFDKTVVFHQIINTCDDFNWIPASTSPNFINSDAPFEYNQFVATNPRSTVHYFNENRGSLILNHSSAVYSKFVKKSVLNDLI